MVNSDIPNAAEIFSTRVINGRAALELAFCFQHFHYRFLDGEYHTEVETDPGEVRTACNKCSTFVPSSVSHTEAHDRFRGYGCSPGMRIRDSSVQPFLCWCALS